jgi:dihydropyrimidine dehydrogenase (NAD+) subunit PreT
MIVDERFPELKPPLTDSEVQREALRCLLCGGPYAPAPCTVACPTGIDIPGFIDALAHQDGARAGAIVFASNPLAASCARVCPTPVLCEGACVLNHIGIKPVEIGRLQRAAAAAVGNRPPLSVKDRRGAGRHVVVIGAGPSGLACAAELVQWGYRVTVYDERPEPGGLVRYAIAPYRQWSEPLPDEIAPLRELGVTFHFNTRLAGREAFQRLESEADAIFLGVGLGEDTRLDLPGQDLPGVYTALDFVAALKTGHAPAVGRTVVVFGGGNTAVDVAREAVRLGAQSVTIVYRRRLENMPAYRYEVEEAEVEGVHFQWLTVPVRFVGGPALRAVDCLVREPSAPEGEGIPLTLPADTAILAIGQQRRHALTEWIPGLRFEHGALAVDPDTGQTPNPKYFAGGDVTGGETVVEAVAAGRRAARGIDRVLSAAR